MTPDHEDDSLSDSHLEYLATHTQQLQLSLGGLTRFLFKVPLVRESEEFLRREHEEDFLDREHNELERENDEESLSGVGDATSTDVRSFGDEVISGCFKEAADCRRGATGCCRGAAGCCRGAVSFGRGAASLRSGTVTQSTHC